MRTSISFIKQPGPAVMLTKQQEPLAAQLTRNVQRELDKFSRLHVPALITITYDIQAVPK